MQLSKFGIVIALAAPLMYAETAQERLSDAASIFKEIMATPEKSIPEDLVDKAHCVVIVPGLKQAAFGIGGKYGRGFAICRRDEHAG